VRRHGNTVHTESIILRSTSGTIRRISADHRADRWD
jgi:fructose-1,6-bisphosphatase II